MTQMATAVCARHFSAAHAMTSVFGQLNGVRSRHLCKTGPARQAGLVGIILGATLKQQRTAIGTPVLTCFIIFEQRSAVWSFSTTVQ